MTKKDYELIAASIKDNLIYAEPGEHAGIEKVARALASALGYDNPRFDTGRFLRACGIQA